MIQGCGSDVGKSLLVAGLCRLFTNRGLTVRPFKPQNMSNNAAVTASGGEMARAQALQAFACRTEPTVHMNPILLKPENSTGAQLIVRGERVGTMQASAYREPREQLLTLAVDSYRRLQAEADLVLVEGAGSPAETNLRAHDVANMGFAHAADVPVVLVADIERGHAIAALVGAHAVLSSADRARIRGFIINKFRGDVRLFDDGLDAIEHHTAWRRLGVVPWLPAATRLPAEDAASLQSPGSRHSATVRIGVLRLPHIANFDDFDPLALEPTVDLRFIEPGRAVPGDLGLLIIPGTKSTIADLKFLREQGWDIDLAAHVRRGGRVLGLCGGYQMLGRSIRDPDGIESTIREVSGLGLLDVETTMTPRKTLRAVKGQLAIDEAPFSGYEMHLGLTVGPARSHPYLRFVDGTDDGAIADGGRIAGCYVHGLWQQTETRHSLLRSLGAWSAGFDHSMIVDEALNEIAATLEGALDIDGLVAMWSP
jgi:adenosylcobyric acid synthase